MIEPRDAGLLYDFLRDDWTVFIAWAATQRGMSEAECQAVLARLAAGGIEERSKAGQ